MAHQDYVSRPRSKNTKKNPYKKNSLPVKAGVTLKVKLMTLFTLVLLAGASYFLWSIKDNQPIPAPSQEIAKPVIDKKSSAIPAPPKEKWSYVDELKTKEVEVGEYEVAEGGPYQMQCGSFRTKAQADALKATIAFAGLESQVRQAQGKSELWYKVILGPYTRKRLAEADKHKLKTNQVNHCQIWSWR